MGKSTQWYLAKMFEFKGSWWWSQMRKNSLKGIVRVPISQCSPVPKSWQHYNQLRSFWDWKYKDELEKPYPTDQFSSIIVESSPEISRLVWFIIINIRMQVSVSLELKGKPSNHWLTNYFNYSKISSVSYTSVIYNDANFYSTKAQLYAKYKYRWGNH